MRWLLVGLVMVVPELAAAQTPTRDCVGSPPDSAWLAAGPVYRDCEVDTPAKRRGGDPRLDRRHFVELGPLFDCREVVLEFVVGAEGSVDTTSVRVVRSDETALTMAVREVLPNMRFDPAQLHRSPVRQLFVYRRGVSSGGGRQAFRVGRVNPGGISIPAPSMTVSNSRSLQACEKK